MNSNTLSAEAREAQRQYYRDWYAKNKKRVQAKKKEYWERKAAEAAERGKTNENTGAIS